MAISMKNLIDETYMQFLYIMDSSYTIKQVIDTFSDFLWTERYCGYGEFEITMPININIITNCRINDFVTIRESDKVMVIETIGIHTDIEKGDMITISGRSLESILERRIILDEVIGTLDKEGNPSPVGVQEAIKTMLTNNAINPTDPNRSIPGLIFNQSSDSRITSLSMESFEERGSNLYTKILNICQDRDMGFKMNIIDEGGFSFELYFGTDRSWNQDSVPAVVFSESYESLINSDYLQTEKDYRSTVYVDWKWEYEQNIRVQNEQGEWEDTTQTISGSETTEVYRDINRSGLSRRESFTSDSITHDIGTSANKTAAINQVVDKGSAYLAGYKVTKLFEGETEINGQFNYGIDYSLGDIVQFENKYGQSGLCRVMEIIRSRDDSGPNLTPTFEVIEGDD